MKRREPASDGRVQGTADDMMLGDFPSKTRSWTLESDEGVVPVMLLASMSAWWRDAPMAVYVQAN